MSIAGLLRAAACVSIGLLPPSMAQGQIAVTVGASADNSIFSDLTDNSNGAGAHLFAGQTSSGGNRRALIRFDLSSIPAHAPIASATLHLRMNKTVSGPADVGVHRLLEAWGEGASNAGEPGGNGTAAAPGDATWTSAFFISTPWSTPGGAFVGTESATTSVNAVGGYSWSGSGLAADVQYWVDVPAENFGWVVIGDESTFTTAKRFDSRNSATLAFRPSLDVEYYCPADFDLNTFVNGDDFDSFTVLFEAGEPGADWDRNTFVNGDDFDGFSEAFVAGC